MTSHSSRQKVSGKRHHISTPNILQISVNLSLWIQLRTYFLVKRSIRAIIETIFVGPILMNRLKIVFSKYSAKVLFCLEAILFLQASLLPVGQTFRPGSFGVSPSKLLKSTEASFRVKNSSFILEAGKIWVFKKIA